MGDFKDIVRGLTQGPEERAVARALKLFAKGQSDKAITTLKEAHARYPDNADILYELGRLLASARADEVHLVLSLAAERQSLFSAIDRFAPLGATRIILTKLDEAERAGAVLQASARARLSVSYVTTGQEVPDDIEVADSARRARLVLDGPAALRTAGRPATTPMRRSA